MKLWLLFQDTNHGGRYFTGKAHPISPDAWSADIRKAMHYDWPSVVNIREWVNANTSGAPIYMYKRGKGE